MGNWGHCGRVGRREKKVAGLLFLRSSRTLEEWVKKSRTPVEGASTFTRVNCL